MRECALIVRDALETLGMKPLAKTSGSKGMHVYVPIVRGPVQKAVWTFAKALAVELASRHPALMTSEYSVAKRPKGRVLVDYNQNRWGSTLASIYSVRPRPLATVSTPLTWDEVATASASRISASTTCRERIAKLGDLWKPLLAARAGRTSRRSWSAAAGLLSEQLADRLQILDPIAVRLEHHQHRHRQQRAPDAPDEAPEDQRR